MIRLSKRLAALADRIPSGARVIDVGTDHGQLPVWLIQSGRAEHVCASDIHPGPLRRAAALAEETETEDSITLRVCDGLDGFTAADADCVVIAGMGGETMIHILSEAPWTANDTLLILQPQSKQAELRQWLNCSGFSVTSEALVEDAGRIYTVLCVKGGEAAPYSPAELEMGKWEKICRDPLFPRLLEGQINRCRKAAVYDVQAAALLEELNEWKGRLGS